MDDQYLKQLLDQLDRRASARNRDETAPAAAAPAARRAPEMPATAGIGTAGSVAAAKLSPTPESMILRKPPAPAAQAVGEAAAARIAPRVERPRAAQPAASSQGGSRPAFAPCTPRTLADAGLRDEEVEAIALQMLLRANASGRDIAQLLRLPYSLVEPLLGRFKAEQWVLHKAAASLSDYLYQLSPAGIEIARRYQQRSSHVGPAPVALDEYIASVRAQSIAGMSVDLEVLKSVFADLLVGAELQNQIGQALQGGRGFFLYGAAGNGKTSIAERVSRVFGQTIWIPRLVSVEGEIVRLFDRCKHIEAPLTAADALDPLEIDRRWVRIQRPTIVAGGELTFDQLEITRNKWTGVCEAPLQLKSNCGTLLIDDFGRQRISASELLNRWIVPLDRGVDYLNLPGGQTIQVPFDQLLVLSTNLQPKDLTDEAFLRRLPYKIEAPDPTESEFRSLFRDYGERLNVAYSCEAVDHLVARHYRAKRRAYRFCQPRDLLLQVKNYCRVNKLPVAMTPQSFDVAAQNYFSLMGTP